MSSSPSPSPSPSQPLSSRRFSSSPSSPSSAETDAAAAPVLRGPAVLRGGDGSFVERAEGLRGAGHGALVDELIDFVTQGSDRQFLTPR